MALLNGLIIETQEVPMAILKYSGVTGTEWGGNSTRVMTSQLDDFPEWIYAKRQK